MAEKEIFLDTTENYVAGYNNDKITFKQIVLEQLNRIIKLGSVEFRKGGYEERTSISNGIVNVNKIYIEDTREVYSNAVRQLSNCLLPHFDKQMSKEEETYRTELKKSYEELNKNSNINYEIKMHNYRNNKKELTEELFRNLCCFLCRMNYLDMGFAED